MLKEFKSDDPPFIFTGSKLTFSELVKSDEPWDGRPVYFHLSE